MLTSSLGAICASPPGPELCIPAVRVAGMQQPLGCFHPREGFTRGHREPRQGRGMRPARVALRGRGVRAPSRSRSSLQAPEQCSKAPMRTALTQFSSRSVPVRGKHRVREGETAFSGASGG